MRVGFLTPELAPNYGWARYALDLATALSAQGVEIVALTQPGAPLADMVAAHHAVLPMLVPRPRGFLLRLLASTGRARRAASDCDLLHVVAEPYTPLAWWLAAKRPVVVTAHGTYVPQTARRRGVGWLYRHAYRHAHLIAVSSFTAGRVRAVLPGASLSIIRNGVDFARFQQTAPAPVKTGPTILATGGVKWRKGTHLLVEALARVRQQVPAAQLVITGRQETAYTAALRQRIAQLGLDDCIHLTGQLPEIDLVGWYQHADVFALPSLTGGGQFEGFGLVFLEASAAGLPVIGTAGSGIEDAVIDGQTGLLVPQDDAPALAEAITRVLTDDVLRARLGAAGRAHAQTQNWPSIAGHVIDVYTRLLASAG